MNNFYSKEDEDRIVKILSTMSKEDREAFLYYAEEFCIQQNVPMEDIEVIFDEEKKMYSFRLAPGAKERREYYLIDVGWECPN